MKELKKITLCFGMIFAFVLLMAMAVYADCTFEIEAPASCNVGDTIEVKVLLSSDEALQDSDVFLIFDEKYFDFIDSEEGEYNANGMYVRFRGDFSANSYSDEWTAAFKAIKSGSVEFSISDKWAQNVSGGTVDSSAEGCTVNIAAGEGVSAEGSVANQRISGSISFSLNLMDPDSVPSCFSETTINLYGTECRAWTLNEKMLEDVDYTSELDAFYALYGYTTDQKEAAWYLYDSKEGTFQRLLMLQDVKVKATKEPTTESADVSGGSSVFEKLTGVMIGVFAALVIIIIVFNVVYSRMEKKSRMKKMEARRRESREELMKKRAAERRAALLSQKKTEAEKGSENESQNMQRPE